MLKLMGYVCQTGLHTAMHAYEYRTMPPLKVVSLEKASKI